MDEILFLVKLFHFVKSMRLMFLTWMMFLLFLESHGVELQKSLICIDIGLNCFQQ